MKNLKVGAIIQARNSSSRLPKKILLDLPYGSGINVLQQNIRRVKKSKLIQDVIVATTTEIEDEIIIEIAQKEGALSYKGSIDDVLSRFYHAALDYELDIIVRITSDCPCIDPELIDKTIELHQNSGADYTSNIFKRTFPRGLDVEVMNFDTLERVYNEARSQYDREHVCPYIYQTSPEKFRISSYEAKNELNYGPEIRITIDTEDDYLLICAIYDYLYNTDKVFNTGEIISLFQKHPWLKILNNKIVQKKKITTLDQEIDEAIHILSLQGLKKITHELKLLKNRKDSRKNENQR